MADLRLDERLQPSLLDRLTDDEPEKDQEAPERWVLTVSRLKEVVKRDLAWLLNNASLETSENLQEYPAVRTSVLNYGVRDFSGRTASGLDIRALEREVRSAVSDFEPRILRHTVRVEALATEDQMNHNALSFIIEGDLWGEPTPISLVLRSEFDLESGNVSVQG